MGLSLGMPEGELVGVEIGESTRDEKGKMQGVDYLWIGTASYYDKPVVCRNS